MIVIQDWIGEAFQERHSRAAAQKMRDEPTDASIRRPHARLPAQTQCNDAAHDRVQPLGGEVACPDCLELVFNIPDADRDVERLMEITGGNGQRQFVANGSRARAWRARH
jgi:hypothetical protein